MGKKGNKIRKESKGKRRYAREPQPVLTEDDEPHLSPRDPEKLVIIPTVEEVKAVIEGKAVLEPYSDVKAATKGKHRVAVMSDHSLEFPELYSGVYIAGDAWEQRNFAEMLARSRCWKAKSIEEADFVVFTGGPDVDPRLYGEMSRHPDTGISEKRDDYDMEIYLQCLSAGIPMLGICRGAQFLHVMNGGKLYQHVDNHNGDHHMWDRDDKIVVDRVSSVHHQMCRPNREGGMHIIATSPSRSKTRYVNAKTKEEGALSGEDADIEAFYYRSTACLGVQGHPEYRGYNYFAYWMMKKINTFFFENPDIEFSSGYRRLKADHIAQRDLNFGDIEPITSNE